MGRQRKQGRHSRAPDTCMPRARLASCAVQLISSGLIDEAIWGNYGSLLRKQAAALAVSEGRLRGRLGECCTDCAL